MSINGNIPTAPFVSGEVLTASKATEIRTGFSGIQAPWDSYTPVLTSTGTNPSLTYTTQTGKYIRFGKTVIGHALIVVNTLSSAGTGTLLVSAPLMGAGAQFTAVGSGYGRYDGSNGAAFAVRWNSTMDRFVFNRSVAGASPEVTTTAPFSLQAGMTIAVSYMYEAA